MTGPSPRNVRASHAAAVGCLDILMHGLAPVDDPDGGWSEMDVKVGPAPQ